MKKLILGAIRKMGYQVSRVNEIPNNYPDIAENEFWDIYALCKPYTMTSVERMYALYLAVDYILHNNIAGDFVECGVWKGGSSMFIAQLLKNRNALKRKIYLYDTYEGMSQPAQSDFDLDGNNAFKLLEQESPNKNSSTIWCFADLDEVKKNIDRVGY